MATSIGDLVATLGVNNRPFKAGLSGAQGMLSGFASKVKSTLGSVAGMFGVGLGAAGMVAFGKSAITAYTEAAQAEKKLGAVIAATGGAAGFTTAQLQEYAAELQRTTNFEDDATVSAMGVLATFREIKGDNFKQATAAAQDMAAVMGTDLRSTIMQVGKALNDPTEGMNALRRAGVSFTDAQKDQIKTLQENGDLMGAQKIVLSELKNEFGGAAKAMADPMVQLRNKLGDLNELIGKQLLPASIVLMETLTGGLESAAKAGGDARAEFGWLGETVSLLGDILLTVKLAVEGIYRALRTILSMGFEGSEQWDAMMKSFKDETPSESMAKLAKRLQDVKDGVGNIPAMAGVFDDVADAATAAAAATTNLAKSVEDIAASQGDDAYGQMLDFAKRLQDEIDIATGVTMQLGAQWRDIVGSGLDADMWGNEIASVEDLMRRVEELRTKKPKQTSAKQTTRTAMEIPGALERGSAEAWKKIAGSIYGKDRDRAVEETAKATRDSADTLRRIESSQAVEAEI